MIKTSYYFIRAVFKYLVQYRNLVQLSAKGGGTSISEIIFGLLSRFSQPLKHISGSKIIPAPPVLEKVEAMLPDMKFFGQAPFENKTGNSRMVEMLPDGY